MLLANPATVAASVEPADVRRQLERMLSSAIFKRSPRLSRLLRHIVEQSLRGEDYRVKEYSIAIEVFGKPETFDPRIDSVVRVAMVPTDVMTRCSSDSGPGIIRRGCRSGTWNPAGLTRRRQRFSSWTATGEAPTP
jgi:hypothetical protein